MNQKYAIKDKIDGKYFTFGNVTPGEKGPRMGLRVSPELRQLINSKEDGQWVNFLLFIDGGNQRQTTPSGPASTAIHDDPPF